MIRRPPRSALFPYATHCRSEETVLSDVERIALDVTGVRLMGVRVALDHFGAGSSSLASLTRLPLDVLKLDRSFLARSERAHVRIQSRQYLVCRALLEKKKLP